jgi:broad-specificity NMP kinase
METKIFFIIGVNGVGKTTVLAHLKDKLSKDTFELHDFDERGVPDNADKVWRISETKHWVLCGEENRNKNIFTVICGFAKPEEIFAVSEGLDSHPLVILLDANKETIGKRINNRYQTEESLAELARTTGKTVEKFIQDNIYVSSLLRKACEGAYCRVVNTDDRTPQDITEEVVKIIQEGCKKPLPHTS